MKSSEKKVVIDSLTEQIKKYNHFYLADISGLNAEGTSELRRRCFKKEVKLVVVKTPCCVRRWKIPARMLPACLTF